MHPELLLPGVAPQGFGVPTFPWELQRWPARARGDACSPVHGALEIVAQSAWLVLKPEELYEKQEERKWARPFSPGQLRVFAGLLSEAGESTDNRRLQVLMRIHPSPRFAPSVFPAANIPAEDPAYTPVTPTGHSPHPAPLPAAPSHPRSKA